MILEIAGTTQIGILPLYFPPSLSVYLLLLVFPPHQLSQSLYSNKFFLPPVALSLHLLSHLPIPVLY